MAMAALGINVNFSAIAKKGQKAFLASFITSVLLMCFAAGVSALFFKSVLRTRSPRIWTGDRVRKRYVSRRPTPRFRHSYPLLHFHPSWRHIL